MKDSDRKGKIARITGGLFLAYFTTTILANVLGSIGLGSPEDMYRVIAVHPWRYKLSLVVSLWSAFLFLSSAWGLYMLLKRIDVDLALAFLLLNAVGVAVHCASLIPLMSAMQLEKSEALVAIDTYKAGFVAAQLFFGTWLFPLGYLIRKSGFVPPIIGIFLMMDGVGVLIWFFQAFLFPNLRVIIYPGLIVSFVAEFSFALWLLIRGIPSQDADREGAPAPAGGT